MTEPIIRNPLALNEDALGENPEPVEVPAEVLKQWHASGYTKQELKEMHPTIEL